MKNFDFTLQEARHSVKIHVSHYENKIRTVPRKLCVLMLFELAIVMAGVRKQTALAYRTFVETAYIVLA